ncbi:hypothetical protein KFL_002230160 [Klebsormidium nitens]|uniref:C3H1-type domain-containing protein n=1 Tax=Klebsormidium nitens TaxID=105231 RepID=A0A1Y1I2N9_KLENI|nr:hypothetical protein KFL_002230160 [Klebsormidium nitens]|eukprot:GAQ85195.1 hypothetical protein KFL_002230160 [Klebsormidium nitens]
MSKASVRKHMNFRDALERRLFQTPLELANSKEEMEIGGPRYLGDPSLGDLDAHSLSQAFHRMRIQQQVALQTERILALRTPPGGISRADYAGWETPSPPHTPIGGFHRAESPVSPFVKSLGMGGGSTSPRSVVDAHVAEAYKKLFGEEPFGRDVASPGIRGRSAPGPTDAVPSLSLPPAQVDLFLHNQLILRELLLRDPARAAALLGGLGSPKPSTPGTPRGLDAAGKLGQPQAQNSLYKTELCRSWEETGACRYGAKCQFAHGREELREIQRHPKYKTEICRTFSTNGTCPYGTRCRFIHGSAPPKKDAPLARSSSGGRRLPIFATLAPEAAAAAAAAAAAPIRG